MKSTKQNNRRGLSTLELVLALPILLFLMALMINYGVVATWKERAVGGARHTVFASRSPRTNAMPRPREIPATAGVNLSTDKIPQLDDPRVNLPVARGPLPNVEVNSNLLDPSRGMRRGQVSLHQQFPILGNMGKYHLQAATTVLDDKWQFGQMGIGSNMDRRLPFIYSLAKAPADLVNQYVQSVVAILRATFRPALRPLDNDDEFAFYGALIGVGIPDFHPRLRRFCSLDKDMVQTRVDNLIDRIQGKIEKDAQGRVVRRIPDVAQRMSRAFINLYERVIDYYNSVIAGPPAIPPAQAASIQAQISTLQGKIDQLNQFLQKLTGG